MKRLLYTVLLLCVASTGACDQSVKIVSPELAPAVSSAQARDKHVKRELKQIWNTFETRKHELQCLSDAEFDYKLYWELPRASLTMCDIYNARHEVNPFMDMLYLLDGYHKALLKGRQATIDYIGEGQKVLKKRIKDTFGQADSDTICEYWEEKPHVKFADRHK